MLLEPNFGLEVTAALKIVEQIAPAFVEQVLIDGVLFEDRYILFERPAPDLESLSSDLHSGSRNNVECVIDGVRLLAVGLLGYGNLGQQSILLLIFLAKSIQRIAYTLHGDRIAGVHFRHVLNLPLRKYRISCDGHVSHPCLGSGIDYEKYVDLLPLRIFVFTFVDQGAVVTVLFHEPLNVRQSALDLVGSKKIS